MVTRNHNKLDKKDQKFKHIGTKIIRKIIDDYKDDENIIGIYVAPFKESIVFYEKNGFKKINEKFMCYYLKSLETILSREDMKEVFEKFNDDNKVLDGKTKKKSKKKKKRKNSKSKSKKKRHFRIY